MPKSSNANCQGSVSEWRCPASIARRTALAIAPRSSRWPATRSEERRVGKECRSLCDWSSDVCSSDLECELPGIGLGVEVPGVDRQAHRLGDRAAQFALAGHEQVSDRPRAVVVFHRGGEQEAAAGEIVLQPGEPVGEQRAKTRQPARLRKRRREHFFLEQLLGLLEREDLQVFLGAEVGEEPALRKTEPRSERSDRQTLQADLARQADGLLEDHRPGLLSFAHRTIIIRTFVYDKILFESPCYDVTLRKCTRQVKRKGAPFARDAAHPDLAPKVMRQFLADRKPEARAPVLAAPASVDLLKGVEDHPVVLLGDSHPSVAHGKGHNGVRPVETREPRRPPRCRG